MSEEEDRGAGEPDGEETAEILDAWLKAQDGAADAAGRAAAREEWLARHPEHAEDLRASLDLLGALDHEVAAALASGAPGSALSRLGEASGTPSRPVLLREEADASPPILSSRATVEGRYQIAGEIARGGMGVVLKGYDVDLAREVAVKVLRDEHADRPDLVRRFIEEAQIGGQLQHPGIPPVYEIGVDAARRPYFAMKLLRGRTLAHLLQDRDGDPATANLVTVFSSICQTVAYAHARGVIHRDLKPSNVMVGSFGEVLVLDWGMGKVLARGGVEEERRSRSTEGPPVRTVRGPGSGGESVAGSVMGTGPYLCPEQARGETDSLDERADVFGLGAILCEILTGKPPYVGAPEEVLEKAFHADLGEAHERISASGADAALVALAKSCLSPAREDRPRHGGAVARAVTAYLASVEERRRAAEAEVARTAVRVAEERKRRRLSVALAAAILGLVLVGGGGWTWVDAQRRDREATAGRRVAEALEETAGLRPLASDAAGWARVRAAARRAEVLSRDGAVEGALRDRVVRTLADVEASADVAERALRQAQEDDRLVKRLEEIRQSLADHFKSARRNRAYRDALAPLGLDPETVDPAAFAARLRDPIRLPVVLALAEWRESERRGGRPTARFDAVLDACDPDPWRRRLRLAVKVEELVELAGSSEGAEPPVESLLVLVDRLGTAKEWTRAADLAKRAWMRSPGDFWACYSAAAWARSCTPPRYEDALRFAAAAVAVRPTSAAARHSLGVAFHDLGDLAAAELQLRETIRLDDRSTPGRITLASVLLERDDVAGAEDELRRVIAMDPASARAYDELGNVLGVKGDAEGEEAAYRKAIELASDFAEPHDHLGTVVFAKGQVDDAITEYLEAIRLDATLAVAHGNLGIALDAKGRHEDAVASYREAIRLSPRFWGAYMNMAGTLEGMGQLAQAAKAYREGARFGGAIARMYLGNFLARRGEFADAEREFRAALALSPGDARARRSLGIALHAQGDVRGAEAELRGLIQALRAAGKAVDRLADQAEDGEVFRVDGGDAVALADVYAVLVEILVEHGEAGHAEESSREAIEAAAEAPAAWFCRGLALSAQGRFAEAATAYRKARELDTAWKPELLARAIAEAEDLDARLPAVLEGRERPRDGADALRLAEGCRVRGHFATAAALFAEALPGPASEDAPVELWRAACAAARAAGEAGPSDARAAGLRAQAAAWLRDALARLEGVLRPRRFEVARRLRIWQRDPDLASLRDAESLSRLPPAERELLASFWTRVEEIARDRAGP